MLQEDGKTNLCMSSGRGAVAVLSCAMRRGLTLLLTCAMPRTEPAATAAAPAMAIAIIFTEQDVASLGNQASCVWKLLLCYYRLFYSVQRLLFLCGKCARVQCQTLEVLPVPPWFDHSVHYTPAFDSTVTCCALPQSPSPLSCAT